MVNPSSSQFGIYVHIPYCLQRCRYCDFATYEQGQILPPEQYLNLLLAELRQEAHLYAPRELTSVYFGGGTPSLVPAEHIVTILREIQDLGLVINKDTEVTIEINPATVDPAKLDVYTKGGVNRFSVGAQTFNDRLLQSCGRRHSAEDTRKTLSLLKNNKLNYSFDLLFALPHQSLEELRQDLDEIVQWSPPHLSPYCLTVPSGHPMSLNRPSEDAQIEMFHMIENALKSVGIFRYEISNFAKSGFESRHNFLYWSDHEYWGIGLSAHSYIKTQPWGHRFWNPSTIEAYAQRVKNSQRPEVGEVLELHQAMTDYCHMHLRTETGLSLVALHQKFPISQAQKIVEILQRLDQHGLVTKANDIWRLTDEGRLVSNLVFEKLTFLKEDINSL